MDTVLAAVDELLPDFNKYMLLDFRREQLKRIPKYMATIYQEAVRYLNDPNIEFLGHRMLRPEEQVKFETANHNMINIRSSSWTLHQFKFRYIDSMFRPKIYLPHLINDFIIINDTRYLVMLTITDKVFTRINGGISCVMHRSPLSFWRDTTITMEGETSGNVWFESPITAKIYLRKRKGKMKIKPTIIHYLLCKYDFYTVMQMFDIEKDDIRLVNEIDATDRKYEYFLARKMIKSRNNCIWLRVTKELMDGDNRKIRVVASLLYTLRQFRITDISDLMNPNGIRWRIMLGKILHPSAPERRGLGFMDTHISSMDTYLSPIKKKQLEAMDIYVGDIYDLLRYIFWNIDVLMLDAHSDLYNKKIDVLDMLLIPTLVRSVYNQFYRHENQLKKRGKPGANLFRIPAMKIAKIYGLPSTRLSPSMYGPNLFHSILTQKIRINSSAVAGKGSTLSTMGKWFDISMAAVESVLAFSQSNPGGTGSINPMVTIDKNGVFIQEEYLNSIKPIRKYLPHR